jgi:hypothetical protein
MHKRACGLERALGRTRACAAASCPLYEAGGAVLPSGCRLERLGVALTAKPELADALLEIRRLLERASTRAEREEAHARLDSLLPGDRED